MGLALALWNRTHLYCGPIITITITTYTINTIITGILLLLDHPTYIYISKITGAAENNSGVKSNSQKNQFDYRIPGIKCLI